MNTDRSERKLLTLMVGPKVTLRICRHNKVTKAVSVTNLEVELVGSSKEALRGL